MKEGGLLQLHVVFLALGLAVLGLSSGGCDNSPNSSDDLLDVSMIDLRATWSNANNLIAYVHYHLLGSTDPDSSGVYTIKPDGTDKKLLYESFLTYSLDWSSDGAWVLANTNARLVRISYPDGQPDTLTEAGEYWGAVFSPDDSQIAFAKHLGDEAGVYIMPAAGGEAKLIAGYGRNVDWPYFDSLLYLSLDRNFGLYAICMIDTSGQFRRVVLPEQGNFIHGEAYPTMHVASSKIILQAQEPGNTYSIWRVNGNRVIQLRSYAYTPEFSPDGSMVLYTNTHSDNGRLWIINWDGTGARQLTQ